MAGIKKKLMTGVLAGFIGFGGLATVATPANAAVYGQPGTVNCEIVNSVRTAPFERRVTWECDYRTSLGVVIKDAVRYDSTKRSFLH